VEPGYLQEHLPTEMPQAPEKWQDIMEDMKKYIIPGRIGINTKKI